MKNEIIVNAPTVEQAIKEALEQLDLKEEDALIEVLTEPVKKFFGDATDAEVKVSPKIAVSDEDAQEGEVSEDEGKSEDSQDKETSELSTSEDISTDNKESKESKESQEEDAVSDDAESEDERNYNETLKQLTEEELDLIADTAIETIRDFLGYFGVEEADVDEYEGEEGELILDVVGGNLAVLIGRHGKTLEAIQFLVSSIVGKKTGYRHPIVIDVEGYKHRRKQKLISIAKSSATRAIRQKHEVHLRPMTPYERRIVHVALKNDKRVMTRSEGIEPNRHIVIELS
jgi:spoIIIJ-associated protein